MTIRELLAAASTELQQAGQIPDQAWLEAESLLAKASKHDKAWLISHGPDKASVGLKAQAHGLLKRRLKGEPLAYLLGSAIFYGYEFLVNRSTLIPRAETEALVTAALQDIAESKNNALVWDVGVGSGAIAISVAASASVPVIASDRSSGALEVAKKNAAKIIINKKARPTFFLGSLLTARIEKAIESQNPQHLIILANLPYLPDSDKKALSPSVTKFEPHGALFSGADGLTLIHQFLRQLHTWPFFETIPVKLYLEFDPPQAKTLTAVAKSLFPKAAISIFKDDCGHDRFLCLLSTPTE